MKRLDLSPWAPPGLNLKPELRLFTIGLEGGVLYACGFLYRCGEARLDLYTRLNGTITSTLIPGAVMPDFSYLLGHYWAGLGVLALCMLGLMAYHYLYHRQGSKSIYLMRRLPSRWELHRRCLTLPLLAMALCLLTAFLLLLLFYGIYLFLTPPECLTPHQWQKVWSVIP